jgi:thiol:disulfide interchange protein
MDPPVKLPLSLLLAASLAACTKTVPSGEDTTVARPPVTASASASEPAPAAASPHVWSKLASAGGPLADQVKAEVKKARALGLKPIVYGGAVWCKPCQAVKKYREDRRMLDAFRGTYVIEIDVDAFSAEEMIAMYGKKLAAVPVFLAIGDDGKSTGPQITSSAWGEDIPENMAPPLEGFLGKL